MIEAISDTMAGEPESSYLPPPGLRIEELANELTTVKAAISFPLSENRKFRPSDKFKSERSC